MCKVFQYFCIWQSQCVLTQNRRHVLGKIFSICSHEWGPSVEDLPRVMEGLGHAPTTRPHPHPLEQTIWFTSVTVLVGNIPHTLMFGHLPPTGGIVLEGCRILGLEPYCRNGPAEWGWALRPSSPTPLPVYCRLPDHGHKVTSFVTLLLRFLLHRYGFHVLDPWA